jgi:ribosomal-protein-alanine N-acetyltransferase
MEQLSIRPLAEADIPQVLAIETKVYQFPWTERNFTDSIHSGYLLHCLLRKHEVIGYIVMMEVVDEYHLLNISIREDLQGQGLGRYLLEWGLAQAKASQMQGMLLEVRPSNVPAQRLYEKLGFECLGVRKNYYPATQGREDALVLMKRFHDE